MSKKPKTTWQKAKKLNRKAVTGSRRLALRGMLAGVGLLAFSPIEDSILGPIGIITAPFTGMFGIGLIGASIILPDKAIERLFFRATGVAGHIGDSGGGYGHSAPSAGRYERQLEDEPYEAPRRGGRVLGSAALILGTAAAIGLVVWVTKKKKVDHGAISYGPAYGAYRLVA